MNFLKITVILSVITLLSACGSGSRPASTTSTTDTSTDIETVWVDTPTDGKLLFKGAIKNTSVTAEVLLKAQNNDLGKKFVDTMIGTYDASVNTGWVCQEQAGLAGILCATQEYAYDLNLLATLRILNLDYFNDGNVQAEINCPETTFKFGKVQYSTIPATIDLTVKNDIKISCSGIDGVNSYYVTIFRDQNPAVQEGFELKFDFEQRTFIGKMNIKDKTESEEVFPVKLNF